jgi:hypothetical protein
MRNFLIVSGAALAASILVIAAASAAAPAPPAPPAPAAAAPAAPAPAATTLGTRPIQVDGYRYGGELPVGSDKNLDALRVLIKAAEGTGMVRLQSPYLVLGDTTNALRINGTGTYNGQKVRVVMDWDYRYPGVRMHVQSPDGKTQQITVARDKLAWDEKTPGVYGGAAQTSAVDRLLLAYLMPTAVILAGRAHNPGAQARPERQPGRHAECRRAPNPHADQPRRQGLYR